ncbi:hypothetical protein PILCRDRAFT_815086 [Piloderma croceum F 1598]|uniref:Uncharacterized protein n=1 Tax=Piloderma croceum (strain F 1598) TaxID=765440 RepID=A0A0C3G6V1_PILCF|nr:hypothetical protein PILCRDRAFT_815086 [Piloderma croceum F 1598]
MYIFYAGPQRCDVPGIISLPSNAVESKTESLVKIGLEYLNASAGFQGWHTKFG